MDCQVCGHPGKYKCPACLRPACSLACSRKHKQQFSCAGTKDRTNYVPIHDFAVSTLKSDVALITDIARLTNQAHKQITKLGKFDTRKRFAYLMNRCREQRIALRVLPKCMSRHNNNGSYFDKELETIFWQTEWHFLTRKQCSLSVTLDRVSEKLPITTVLAQALEKLAAGAEFLYELQQMGIALESITCAILWLREKARADEDKIMQVFVQVNPSFTLGQALQSLYTPAHPIIEYPELYLAPQQMLEDLIIVNSSSPS